MLKFLVAGVLAPFALGSFVEVSGNDASGAIDVSSGDAQEFSFALISDAQLGKFAEEQGGDEQGWYLDAQLLNAAVTQLNHFPNLKFIMHLGNQVQAYPTYCHKADPANNQAQISDARAGFDLSNFPVFTVPGERDLGKDWEDVPSDNPSAVVDEYTSQWGDDYFSFKVGSTQFVAIDTPVWMVESEHAAPFFSTQFQWLENTLASADSDASVSNVVVFMHNPPYWQESSEKDDKYNLPFVNDFVNATGTDGTCRQRFFDALPTSKPVWINAGRLHVDLDLSDTQYNVLINNAITMTKEDGDPDNKWMTGLGGVRLVTIKGSEISHQFLRLEELAANYPGM